MLTKAQWNKGKLIVHFNLYKHSNDTDKPALWTPMVVGDAKHEILFLKREDI